MDRYLGTASGAVLGPYAPEEITAWELGKQTLGHPEKAVYAVTASSYEDARRKIARASAREASES